MTVSKNGLPKYLRFFKGPNFFLLRVLLLKVFLLTLNKPGNYSFLVSFKSSLSEYLQDQKFSKVLYSSGTYCYNDFIKVLAIFLSKYSVSFFEVFVDLFTFFSNLFVLRFIEYQLRYY